MKESRNKKLWWFSPPWQPPRRSAVMSPRLSSGHVYPGRLLDVATYSLQRQRSRLSGYWSPAWWHWRSWSLNLAPCCWGRLASGTLRSLQGALAREEEASFCSESSSSSMTIGSASVVGALGGAATVDVLEDAGELGVTSAVDMSTDAAGSGPSVLGVSWEGGRGRRLGIILPYQNHIVIIIVLCATLLCGFISLLLPWKLPPQPPRRGAWSVARGREWHPWAPPAPLLPLLLRQGLVLTPRPSLRQPPANKSQLDIMKPSLVMASPNYLLTAVQLTQVSPEASFPPHRPSCLVKTQCQCWLPPFLCHHGLVFGGHI